MERGADTWANPVSYDKLGRSCRFLCCLLPPTYCESLVAVVVVGIQQDLVYVKRRCSTSSLACTLLAVQLSKARFPRICRSSNEDVCLTCHVVSAAAVATSRAAVRYRRWRNGVASGRLPDGTTSIGSSKDAAITMTAGELFKLEEDEGFRDLQEQQQQQEEQQAEAEQQQQQQPQQELQKARSQV